MIDRQAFLKARPYLSIVHRIPGRIRLRFDPRILAEAPEFAGPEGQAALAEFDAIEDLRVNAAAFSLVIRYDAERIPPRLWDDFITGSDEAADKALNELWEALG